jgi:hypothetical protein
MKEKKTLDPAISAYVKGWLERKRGKQISAAAAETHDFIQLLYSFHRNHGINSRITKQRARSSVDLRYKNRCFPSLGEEPHLDALIAWYRRLGLSQSFIDYMQSKIKNYNNFWPKYSSSSDIEPSSVAVDELSDILTSADLQGELDLNSKRIRSYKPSYGSEKMIWVEERPRNSSEGQLLHDDGLRSPPIAIRQLVRKYKHILEGGQHISLTNQNLSDKAESVYERLSEKIVTSKSPSPAAHRMNAVESLIGRQVEGMIDAAIEGIFQTLEPYAHSSTNDTWHVAADSQPIAEEPAITETRISNDNGDGEMEGEGLELEANITSKPLRKRKRSDGAMTSAKRIFKDKIRKVKICETEVKSGQEHFSWDHVLTALQWLGAEVRSDMKTEVSVHDSLPILNLSHQLLDRVRGRLHGLYLTPTNSDPFRKDKPRILRRRINSE